MGTVAFTAPHAGASDIGLKLLQDGASAVDAMIAAAAAITVLYPHMNSLGGDGFWLIHHPDTEPVAIDACGSAAALADITWYRDQDLDAIPSRGAKAALCMGGTLDGWRCARDWQQELDNDLLPLSLLMEPARKLARHGVKVTESLQRASEKVQDEFRNNREFQALFCPEGRTLLAGDTLFNPALGDFLQALGESGTEDFYRGELAARLAGWLESEGSPLRLDDFNHYHARRVEPLSVSIQDARLFNLPAPTQGVASLLILAIYDRLCVREAPRHEADHVHLLVEATKQAFLIRDREVTDPSRLSEHWSGLLQEDNIQHCASQIDGDRARPWPETARPGDTIWMGALDHQGTLVSFIQSIYWEFGSGLVMPEFGLLWNNRGLSFSLDSRHPNALTPGLKPFHTLNPALALLHDGGRLSYGTMGGEGQPQTQSAIVSRLLYQGYELEAAISTGRWLLGRTWGDSSQDLKLEADLYGEVGENLLSRGHRLEMMPPLSEMMGHAGAICMGPHGAVTAASDPRSDGAALTGLCLGRTGT